MRLKGDGGNMNYSLQLLVLAVGIGVMPSAAQSTPPMQKGINVELAAANNTEPLPEADKENAVIVTVTEIGSVYLGTAEIKTDALATAIKDKLSDPQQTIYLKVDARAPYAQVESVLKAAQSTRAYEFDLLTAAPTATKPQGRVPPNGIAVRTRPVGGLSPFEFALVEVLHSEQREPVLKIRDNQIAIKDLRSTLLQTFQKQPGGSVGVEADGKISFADIVRVIDTVRSMGAKVTLVLRAAKGA
jgi:biopolymer transport protein ExbD